LHWGREWLEFAIFGADGPVLIKRSTTCGDENERVQESVQETCPGYLQAHAQNAAIYLKLGKNPFLPQLLLIGLAG